MEINQISDILYRFKDYFDKTTVEENFLKFCLENLKETNSQSFQDLWVAFEIQNGFVDYDRLLNNFQYNRDCNWVIDVGAFDGIRGSNSLYFSDRGYQRLCVEPNSKLVSDYFMEYTVWDYRVVWNKTGENVNFIITDDPQLSTMENYENDDYHADTRKREGRSFIERETVTLYDLLDDWYIPNRIVYLSLDTEGSEYDILTKFFEDNNSKSEKDRYVIDYLTVEHNYNNKQKHDWLMLENGYELRFPEISRWDSFYRRLGIGK